MHGISWRVVCTSVFVLEVSPECRMRGHTARIATARQWKISGMSCAFPASICSSAAHASSCGTFRKIRIGRRVGTCWDPWKLKETDRSTPTQPQPQRFLNKGPHAVQKRPGKRW